MDAETLKGLLQLTSVGSVVALTILILNFAKRLFAGRAWLGAVPMWVYGIAVSCALTTLAHYGFQTLTGEILDLLIDTVIYAAAATGFYEWWQAGSAKPLSASTAAIRERLGYNA